MKRIKRALPVAASMFVLGCGGGFAGVRTPDLGLDPSDTAEFFSPDCDFVQVPVPPGGALEGETGYQCTTGGDCHLIVVHRPTRRLYEMWRANMVGSTFTGGCLAVWDLTLVYPPSGRGENCTSADAAGYPIAPLLFTADEVAAGAIEHAIRFILPNYRIRRGVYLRPATHSTSAAGGGSGTPPYGARFRLRADFPLQTLPNEGAREVARALQRYGMFLADGGIITLTAQSDRTPTLGTACETSSRRSVFVRFRPHGFLDPRAGCAETASDASDA